MKIFSSDKADNSVVIDGTHAKWVSTKKVAKLLGLGKSTVYHARKYRKVFRIFFPEASKVRFPNKARPVLAFRKQDIVQWGIARGILSPPKNKKHKVILNYGNLVSEWEQQHKDKTEHRPRPSRPIEAPIDEQRLLELCEELQNPVSIKGPNRGRLVVGLLNLYAASTSAPKMNWEFYYRDLFVEHLNENVSPDQHIKCTDKDIEPFVKLSRINLFGGMRIKQTSVIEFLDRPNHNYIHSRDCVNVIFPLPQKPNLLRLMMLLWRWRYRILKDGKKFKEPMPKTTPEEYTQIVSWLQGMLFFIGTERKTRTRVVTIHPRLEEITDLLHKITLEKRVN